MVIEEGIVVEQKGGQVLISMERTEACEGCPTTHICKPDGNRMILRAKDPFGVTVGQKVKVAVEPANYLYPAFWVYGFPLLSLIGGAIIGQILSMFLDQKIHSQLYSAMGALIGLALSLFVVKWFNARIERGLEYLPVVIEVET
ncbi:MAG: SoxR reducing system RseC family protein [Nitrospirae bacterium]|nr:SoxR reducing system RseC family protein [Nitrospirota bacterium]